MSNKALKIILVTTTLIIVIAGTFSGGFLAGNVYQKALNEGTNNPLLESIVSSTPVPQATNSGTPTDLRELFKPFWETWDVVHNEFVKQPVDDTLLMRGAIQGMLDSLGDKHTSYIDPAMLRQANIQLTGEYDGIGAWVDVTTEFLTIISPMPNSPAEKAGLKPEDQVIAIDGEDMTGIDGNVVLKKVLGPAGSKVTLSILRKDITEPFDVLITREKIVVPSVVGKMVENNIAHIQISTFGENTKQELETSIEELLANHSKGLILDLRYNGGGLVDSAVDVASQFIKEDVVMYEQFGDGTLNAKYANKNGLARDIPLVVLVNEGTASASEIVAGAIQDYGRAKIVGVKSYGKGSEQTWRTLEDDQGAIRVTVAAWLTPLKRQINEVGLTPDFIVELTEEDIKNGKDPQLQKAIDLLSQ
jgi:carboxyl-terminal processing protease